MEVLLEVPDDIAEILQGHWQDLPRRVMELLATESYRAEALTTAEVQRMLGFETRMQTDEFLKREHAYLHYTEKDLENDIETFRRFSRA